MIELIPVHGLPEIREGDDLAALVVELLERGRDPGEHRKLPGSLERRASVARTP